MISFFPFSCLVPRLSLSPYLLFTVSFLLSPCSHILNFCVPICFACTARFPGRIPPPVRKGCMHHLCTLVCHLVPRQRQICSRTNGSATCSSAHFCPGRLETRVYNMAACCLFRKMEGGKVSGNNGTNETCHFSLHIFSFFLLLSLSSGPLSIQTVYLGQASSFMCTTPRQSEWTLRRGEGR